MAEQAGGQHRQWVLDVLGRYEGPLTRFARRLLRDEDAAREVVQDTFLRLCAERCDELAGREAQWLFAVCRNRALDVLRSRGRLAPLAEEALDELSGHEPDPAQTAERGDLLRYVGELVDRLPLSQRQAVLLWCEGFDYRQIAAIGETTEGNVRVLVHRAFKRLREHPAIRRLLDLPPAEADQPRAATARIVTKASEP